MSRGLGVLQRRILDTLDEARAAMPSYRGATMGWTVSQYGQIKPADYDWTLLGEYVVVLAPGVYDLRCSAAYLADTLGHVVDSGRQVQVSPSFKASFARATHGLVARGLLAQLREVPVTEIIRPRNKRGTSAFWYSRQLRFVTLSANPVGLTLRGNQRSADGLYLA
jgi:hypothetical protein